MHLPETFSAIGISIVSSTVNQDQTDRYDDNVYTLEGEKYSLTAL